jgi:hypothetical protein
VVGKVGMCRKNHQQEMAKGSTNKEQRRTIMDPKLDEIKAYRDREERVYLPASDGPNWKDQFKTKDAVNKLFQDIRIVNEEIIEINPAPALSEDRLTLFLITRNIKTGTPTRVIIDTIAGSPTSEQFIEVTYDLGTNTDLKIIVYYDEDSDSGLSKPAGHSAYVSNLVKKNNRCGVRTFLVQAMFLIKREGKVLRYVIDQGPYSNIGNSLMAGSKTVHDETLPTKRQVQEAEWWVGYHYGHWICRGLETLGRDFDATDPLGITYSIDDDIEARAFWDDNGLSVRLTSRRKPETLYRLWKYGRQTLMDKFPECTIDVQPDSEEGPVITISVLEIPMSELISMDVEDKRYYGKKAYNEEIYLEYIVECILGGKEVR